MTTVFTLSSYLLKMYRQIRSNISYNQYDEAIEKVDSLLNTQNLNQIQKDDLLYYKAIALDCKKLFLQSLMVLTELKERSPASIFILNSIRIVSGNVAVKAAELIEKDPTSKEILKLESILVDLDFCPSLVRLHAAKMRATLGESTQAIQLAKAYLELSPNDEDYLRAAIEIAKIAHELTWADELLNHLKGLIEKYPFRVELTEILDDVLV
jgi:tetratricopeptide (TPR) repeat protein